MIAGQIYNKHSHDPAWWKTVLMESVFYNDAVGKLLDRGTIEGMVDGLIAAATSAGKGEHDNQ